ncbi:MAG: ABC transporter ATP-binding protein [Lachnospiraceae bacterium]|nr:ABC transporter ATP-binding protein [Lachnospiraceae bacterium]
MKKISCYLTGRIHRYLLAIASMVIATSLDMVSPQLTKHIIDDVIVGGQLEKLSPLLAGIFVIGAARFVFGYVKEYGFDTLAAGIGTQMRRDLFDHIQSLSAEFFDRTGTGELMTRVKDDIDALWNALGYVSMLILEVVYHVGIILFCMYSLNWKLALLPTLVMIFCGWMALRMERELDAVYEKISEENAVLNSVAEENLAGVRTVRAFTRERHEIKKFLSHNKRYYELNMTQSKIFVRYSPYFSAATRLTPLLTLLFGGALYMTGEVSLGTLGAFVEYSMNIVWPMEMLGWLTNDLSTAVGSYKKIKRVYDNKPAIREEELPVCPEKIGGRIRFEGVSFKRTKEQYILKDISFTVEPGKTLGIMGATGSGKSSVVQLLQRMYEPEEGSIYLDDIDIKRLSLKQLRSSISMVMQEVFLFSDTVSENIRLGARRSLTEEDIATAGRRAQAEEFVEQLSHGYETVIGERGVGLSGGQKQRISIARALSKGAPVLVLDDATSALDMETEHAIWQEFHALKKVTKIIITHRISAVRDAEEIIILDKGRIAERGTHTALLEKKGLYYETFRTQYESVWEKGKGGDGEHDI